VVDTGLIGVEDIGSIVEEEGIDLVAEEDHTG